MPHVAFLNCFQKMFAASASRSMLVWSLILFLFGVTAFADGTYQRTKDGKTIVWNQDPKPTDRASWSGDRDRGGYADGFGTLTWFTNSSQGGEDKETIYARYFGNMVLGKFEGPVNGHSKGVTGHAVFSQGKRITPWAAGPVSSWRTPKAAASPVVAQTSTAAPTPAPTNVPQFNPPPPSYPVVSGGRAAPDSNRVREPSDLTGDIPEEGPGEEDRPVTNAAAASAGTPKPKVRMEDSLMSLVGPPPSGPSGLKARSSNKAVDASDASRLSEHEVIQLADAEARRRGYDLSAYQRGHVQFDPADNIWSLLYTQKADDKSRASRKHFVVAIDEKSGRTAVVSSR